MRTHNQDNSKIYMISKTPGFTWKRVSDKKYAICGERSKCLAFGLGAASNWPMNQSQQTQIKNPRNPFAGGLDLPISDSDDPLTSTAHFAHSVHNGAGCLFLFCPRDS